MADAARQVEALDILVNNAGISLDTASAPDGTDVDTFRRTYETNVFGVATVTSSRSTDGRRQGRVGESPRSPA